MADTVSRPGDPFTFQLAQHSSLTRAAFAAARPLLSRLFQLPACRALYHQAQIDMDGTFEARVLRALDIRVRVDALDAAVIPAHGPLIVAANHPTGALDGLLVIEAVRQIRPDARLIANHLLAAVPELHGSCFFVDPFGGPSAAARSLEGLRAAHLWLRNGGALVVFPAGEVAWRQGPDGRYRDSPWLPAIGRLARATEASVLPVFIDGRNSPIFYAAGRVHPRLRTALLPRELLRQRGTMARVRFGRALRDETPHDSTTAASVTSAARAAVERLACAPSLPHADEIAPPVDTACLEEDIVRLPAERKLLTSGVYDVFCAEAEALPHVLPEIGRLREQAYRAVGEGTGKALDLDCFDAHYQHLVVWNRARRHIVGAYRLARTDRTVEALGVAGLYTSTLFRYDDRLVHRLTPGFELGRSFVRPEYQRSYNALLLLWRGIGQIVARSPECRFLFGPVSISARYQDSTQQMLRGYLAQNHCDNALAGLVQAINPPSALAPPQRGTAAPADVDELDDAIKRLEQRQGMPVLLRQYLRLDATLLGFNVDPAFGDALDALMAVDLSRLPLATLQRYLGRSEACSFLARHKGADTVRPRVAA